MVAAANKKWGGSNAAVGKQENGQQKKGFNSSVLQQ
jgi:hypothetical protein